jgi:polyisoprenoid-binding protein YceI
MRKTILAVAGAAAISTFAITGARADHHEVGEMDTGAITSGSYSTDPGHTLVVWSLDHLGFNDYFGIFGDITGTLDLDTETLSNSSVDVTIPIASVTVASEGLKEHMFRAGADGAAPDFFGPSPEPARFVSTAVHQTGDHSAHIVGDLTFNGVTNQVTINAELAGMGTNMMSEKETVGFHGTTTITRSEWNLGWGIPYGLGDEVELDITVAFEKD